MSRANLKISDGPLTTYTAPSLAGASEWVDVGDVDDVFERAGLTGKGKRQTEFREASRQKVVVRVGYTMLAVEPVDFDRIIARYQGHR